MSLSSDEVKDFEIHLWKKGDSFINCEPCQIIHFNGTRKAAKERQEEISNEISNGTRKGVHTPHLIEIPC